MPQELSTRAIDPVGAEEGDMPGEESGRGKGDGAESTKQEGREVSISGRGNGKCKYPQADGSKVFRKKGMQTSKAERDHTKKRRSR